MAETLCGIIMGASPSKVFNNIPPGSWTLKTSTSGLTINSSNCDTHIPFVIKSLSKSQNASSGSSATKPASTDEKRSYITINGKNICEAYAGAAAAQDSSSGYWSYASISGSNTFYDIFLPAVYDMDLKKCIEYARGTAVTCTMWLEKK